MKKNHYKKASLFIVLCLFFSSFSKVNAAETFKDPFYKDQYYLASIHAQEAWEIQSSASAVVVAVIDDGVFEKHSDLGIQIWKNQKELNNNIDDDKNGFVDDFHGWDFVQNTYDIGVYGSHGTGVAGIFAAMPNNGTGIVGITRGVQIMPLLICGNLGTCDISLLPKAIRYATDNGANIINISLGRNYVDGLNEAIEYAYNKGVVLVAAAGNLNNETDLSPDLTAYPRSPVCNDNGQDMVLGVSAVDKNSKMLPWAAYGNCVDVVAPGENIVTTAVTYVENAEYTTHSGTSFAAPMVAAEAALLKAKYPTMTNRQIMDTIKQTADHNPEYGGKLGSGLINIYKALTEPVFSSVVTTPTTDSIIHPDGGVVLGKDKKTVYVISSGKKRGFATPEEYNSQGFVFSDILKATASDLQLPEGPVVPFADGTLVLDTSDGRTIYMIDNSTKRGFATADVFTGLGYAFNKAVKGNLKNYPTGAPVTSAVEPHPEGALVRDGDKVYKIFQDGKKRILSQDVLNSWHWTENKIVKANDADLKLLEIGLMPYRDGTLVKSSTGGIYVVSNGELRPFSNMKRFSQFGYKLESVINIPDEYFYQYAVGAVI